MATDVPFDITLMLLSADWFADHWGSLGLVVSPEERALVQRAARNAVRAFMDRRASYWSIDFSEKRIRESIESFASELQRSGLPPTVVAQLSDLVSGVRRQPEATATSVWLFTALMDQLASSPDACQARPDLPSDALRSTLTLWEKSSHVSLGIDRKSVV